MNNQSESDTFTTNTSNMIWLAAVAFIIGTGTVLSDPTPVLPHHDIKIRLYAPDESYSVWSLEEAGGLFSDKSYNSTLDLVMIILGFDEDQNTMIQQTVQALLSRNLNESYNILAVDLPEQFSFKAKNLYYLRPALNVPSAGEALGEFINTAMDAGNISPDRINVISFSLGAQIAGYMGRKVNGLLQSITGVDPSGVGFDWSRLVTRLIHVSQEDAKFVHLYHSNSAVFGTTLRLGTADYLFNNGETQPSCEGILDPMCSHLRGFSYYVEALRTSPGLPALQCNNHSHLIHCKCRGNRLSYVGFPLDTKASGMFVLRTREEAPYSLGKDGVVGTKCKSEKSDSSYNMGLYYDQIMNMLERK